MRFCPAILQDWTTHEIDCTWPAAEGPAGLERALHRICADADAAIAAGARFTLLTDARRCGCGLVDAAHVEITLQGAISVMGQRTIMRITRLQPMWQVTKC